MRVFVSLLLLQKNHKLSLWWPQKKRTEEAGGGSACCIKTFFFLKSLTPGAFLHGIVPSEPSTTMCVGVRSHVTPARNFQNRPQTDKDQRTRTKTTPNHIQPPSPTTTFFVVRPKKVAKQSQYERAIKAGTKEGHTTTTKQHVSR